MLPGRARRMCMLPSHRQGHRPSARTGARSWPMCPMMIPHARPAGDAVDAWARKWPTSPTACSVPASASPRSSLLGKINGAVGNYNAHLAAYPRLRLGRLRQDVSSNRSGLDFQPLHHPDRAARRDGRTVRRLCPHQQHPARPRPRRLGLHLARLLQAEGQGRRDRFLDHAAQGSNPIDFENSEGNLGLANAVSKHLAEKLPVSRWQRDLTDSTVLRNMGVGLGYALLGLRLAATRPRASSKPTPSA